MAAGRARKLGATYPGLERGALLRALGDNGETAVLEAFWRYGSADVAADAVSPIVATGDEHLLGLVLDEILSPALDQPAPPAIVSAIDEHRPALAKVDAERLAECLQDETPLHARYEPARASMLAWLVSQPDKIGDAIALDMIAGRVASSDQASIRRLAYARCRGNERLLRDAAVAVAADFEQAPSQQAWQQTAEFVEYACEDQRTTPEPVRPIVQILVKTAPTYFASQIFAATLGRLAVDSALDPIELQLSENMTDTPGARAVLALLPDVTPALRRATLWATAARAQQTLSPVLQQQTTAWDEAEWRRTLRALTSPESVYRPVLDYLVAAAPIELTAELMKLVMSQVSNGDALISTVGQRLGERLQAIGEEREIRDAWVAAVHWPKQSDDEAIEKFDAIAACLEGSLHVRLLLRGYLTKKLRADVAARFVPASEVARALKLVAAGSRGEWAAALAAAHPDEIAAAASDVTSPESYDLGVVAALAPTLSEVAFVGVGAAWVRLSAEQKDELVGLLEQHAQAESLDALCAIIRDDHRDNAKRRGRAARRIGELLEPGVILPEAVLDLLNSNLHDLRSAAVEAIARVKPREPELIARLHDVVAGRGAAGKAAADALDALARELLAEFTESGDKTELHELMPLLAAVGRPDVLAALFEYVGGNAVYDDPALHRAAAAAIREAADRIDEVSSDDQEAPRRAARRRGAGDGRRLARRPLGGAGPAPARRGRSLEGALRRDQDHAEDRARPAVRR